MPFGLNNSPSTFQISMNSIFKTLLKKVLLLFFDDILIYNKSWEEHLQHVDMVLKLLEEKQLDAKPSKCSFGVKEVEYLSHTLSHGVKVDPDKLKAMREWKIPKTLKNIREFLGLIGYYHKFVKNYGQIEAPLTTLLKREAFSWTQATTKTFEKIKEAMCTNLVLVMLDFIKTFIVDYDASGHGIGAVLMQEGRLIVFESS